ncbi:acyl-ACP desaturase [Thalassobaculum sp.]|uniref:acyl-ACP desaturase n=1 Tax=Thalassobaculum sp. TaxID=2022740 RepID=UPI0032ECCBFD
MKPDTHWTLDDVPWDAFDPAKVEPDQLAIVKAAAMVEYNSADYVSYLQSVFRDDPGFMEAAAAWGFEERQHGQALGKWAALADPGFDFETRFAVFRAGFRPDVDATESIRGSRAGELVARCMVEVGTSSYYRALGDAAREPALKAICRYIAGDELRHYKLFYDHLKRFLEQDKIGTLQRLRLAMGRIMETEDDELAYAFYAANNQGEPYDRERNSRAYMRRAYQYYRDPHIERALAMIFKACGLKPHSKLFQATSYGAKWLLAKRQRELAKMAA